MSFEDDERTIHYNQQTFVSNDSSVNSNQVTPSAPPAPPGMVFVNQNNYQQPCQSNYNYNPYPPIPIFQNDQYPLHSAHNMSHIGEPPSYNQVVGIPEMLVSNDDREKYRKMCERIEMFMKQHSIDKGYRDFVDTIPLHEFIIICEDSGSLTKEEWNSMKDDVTVFAELFDIFDNSGVNLLFLNRCNDIIKGVNNENVQEKFMGDPAGFSDFYESLSMALVEQSEKPKVILIMINSKPVTDSGTDDSVNIEEMLKVRDIENNKIVILCRSDNERVVNYVNNLSKLDKNISAIYRYDNEKEKVKFVQGNEFPYSRGDHLIRSLLISSEHILHDLTNEKLHTITDSEGNIKLVGENNKNQHSKCTVM